MIATRLKSKIGARSREWRLCLVGARRYVCLCLCLRREPTLESHRNGARLGIGLLHCPDELESSTPARKVCCFPVVENDPHGLWYQGRISASPQAPVTALDPQRPASRGKRASLWFQGTGRSILEGYRGRDLSRIGGSQSTSPLGRGPGQRC